MSAVIAAGKDQSFLTCYCLVIEYIAQCLFVLSDDNDPAIESLRTDSDHVSCLVQIIHSNQLPANATSNGISKGTQPKNDELAEAVEHNRRVALRVLVCGRNPYNYL